MLPSSAFPKRLDSGRDLEDTLPKDPGTPAFCRVSSGNPSSERGLVVAPQSKRVSPGRMFNISGRDPLLDLQRLLQFLPRASNPARDARNGGWSNGSYLELGRTGFTSGVQ